MSTFGNTNLETGFTANIENTIRGTRGTMGAVAGVLDSMSVYIDLSTTLPGSTYKLKCGLYLVSSGAFVGATVEQVNNDSDADQWKTIAASGTVNLLASTEYFLVAWANGIASTTVSIKGAASGGAGYWSRTSQNYDSLSGVFVDPFGGTELDVDGIISIYATYTETAAGQPTTKRFGAVPFTRGDSGLFVPGRF